MALDLDALLEQLRALGVDPAATGAPARVTPPAATATLPTPQFVRETPMRYPDRPEGPGYWERVGAASGGTPFKSLVPVRTGYERNPFTGRSRNTSPIMALLAIGQALANVKAGQGLTKATERQLFARSQADEAAQRVASRDASFKDAREQSRKVREGRAAQMQNAIDRYRIEANQAEQAAANATDDAGRANNLAILQDRRARIARISADLGRLTGQSAFDSETALPEFRTRPLKATYRPTPKPKVTSSAELRRKVIAAITVENGNDIARIQAYLNLPGVLDTLANKYGITKDEVLRAVPE